MRKEPAKTWFEHDAIGRNSRCILCYLQRAGVRKSAKQQMNRRNRHKWREILKEERK